MSQPLPPEINIIHPVSSSRLTTALNTRGEQIFSEDRTGSLVGAIKLPKDTPEGCYIAVVYEKTDSRDIVPHRVSKNDGRSIELEQDEKTGQIVEDLVGDVLPFHNPEPQTRFPVINVGDELNWNNIPKDGSCGYILNLGSNDVIPGGVMVVFAPDQIENYKKILRKRL